MTGPRPGGGGARPAGPPMGPGRMMMGAGGPPAKIEDFKGSAKRLLKMLAPDRFIVVAVLVFGIASVVLSTLGPRLLGHATDVIFEGIISKRIPAGTTKEQAIEALRARGDNAFADLLSGMNNVVP